MLWVDVGYVCSCKEVLRLAVRSKAKIERLSREKPHWIERIAVVPVMTMTLMMAIII